MVEDAKVAGEGRQDSASSQVEAAFGAVEGAVGLGVDIVEIERMRKILKRSPAFARKVFSAEECRYCDATAQPAVHYATRFAAKEAVLKALGTGFSQGIGARDVEVRRTSKGRPYAVLTGRAKQVAQALGVRELPLSLSYTHTDAVACAMAITEGSVRAQQERRDPMEELARQFKEARTTLDDLDAAAPAPAQPQVPDAHSAMGMVRDAHSAMGMVRDAQGGGRLAATRPHGGAGASGSMTASHKLNADAKRGVCRPRGVNCEESLVLAPAGHNERFFAFSEARDGQFGRYFVRMGGAVRIIVSFGPLSGEEPFILAAEGQNERFLSGRVCESVALACSFACWAGIAC